ncbi:hypothetical protein BpOF4_21349 (plasmid) [Alkalihalophilus pseudofirmus OF4]|uniref:Uncharacterized protein n=1 Tax=Alkalihalophilus pseudofirmus (strain ATCC BAA-2126 / JCM 17055 / OF4) TaxID=398511 RepID=D3G1N9_ALKPO|nr:hypothetical protein BpOF4_21349 [Alkalihalophilus pseudofirmus OF4]
MKNLLIMGIFFSLCLGSMEMIHTASILTPLDLPYIHT